MLRLRRDVGLEGRRHVPRLLVRGAGAQPFRVDGGPDLGRLGRRRGVEPRRQVDAVAGAEVAAGSSKR